MSANEVWLVTIHDKADCEVTVRLFYTEDAAQEFLLHRFDVDDIGGI